MVDVGADFPADTQPATAARIRREFAHVLGTDAGPIGELVALAQLLQACSRGVHPTLAPLIARRAQELTHTPVPTRRPAQRPP
ncbi:hypothetical protein [Streptomyces halstedii]|uniref:hypothetical protein n=1 Tax=Streptomyces halstedii TaxID=1944 RepID=UPI0036B10DE9